jgi:hypothetical protein
MGDLISNRSNQQGDDSIGDQGEDLVFFSPADRRVSASMPQSDFESALVYSFLFEPGVVIPDVFFFISLHVRNHILRTPGESLFEKALQIGAIRPALRSPASSFSGILASVRGIWGLLPEGDLQELVSRYNEATSAGLPKVVLWPDRMGEKYDKLLSKVLQQDDPPTIGKYSVEARIWEYTRRLRFDAIDNAREVELRRPEGGFGVRRGEIINEAGRILKAIEADEAGVSDSDDVIIRYNPSRKGEREAVVEFFSWIDELYRINQAQQFVVRPNVINQTSQDLAIVDSAMESWRRDTGNLGSPDYFEATVRVPSVEYLLSLPSDQLIELRNEGRIWRSKIHRYFDLPYTASREVAEDALQDFAKELRKRAPASQIQQMTVKGVVISAGSGALATAAEVAASQAHLPAGSGAAIVTVLSTGYLTYRLLHHRAVNTQSYTYRRTRNNYTIPAAQGAG